MQAKLKATEIAKERQSKKYYAITAALMYQSFRDAANGEGCYDWVLET